MERKQTFLKTGRWCRYREEGRRGEWTAAQLSVRAPGRARGLQPGHLRPGLSTRSALPPQLPRGTALRFLWVVGGHWLHSAQAGGSRPGAMLKLPGLKMEAFLLQRTRVNSQGCLVLKLINLPRVHGSPDRAAASVFKDGEVTVEEGPERIPAWEQAGQRHQTVGVPGGAALMC